MSRVDDPIDFFDPWPVSGGEPVPWPAPVESPRSVEPAVLPAAAPSAEVVEPRERAERRPEPREGAPTVERTEPTTRVSRWRSASGTPAQGSAPPRAPLPRVAGSPPEAPPLPGIAGFLREVGTAHLEALAERLRKARHDAVVHDALEERDPALRFHFRPWPGPFNEDARGRAMTLEIAAFGQGADERVVARYVLDPDEPAPALERAVPLAKLDAAWIEQCSMDFVRRALERT